MPIAGELTCLFTALLWAVAVTMFRGPIAEHGARAVNMTKCVVGALLQGLTVLALGLGGTIVAASPSSLLLLAGSGVVGLVLGDTALFVSVARIGVHRTLLLQTLSPVFAASLAAAWSGEVPSGRQAAGAAVILLGVGLVVAPARFSRDGRAVPWAAAGVGAGALAALGQGAGLVLAKAGMVEVPVIPASFVRLATAAAGLVLIGWAFGWLGRLPALARSRTTVTRLLPATLLGTYLALFLMMAGVALAPAAIAAVLLSTSPVFSLILESVSERKAPDVRRVIGTLLAVAGVAVLTTG
jgi:drug/metabolite transporter (DMT)-like permease